MLFRWTGQRFAHHTLDSSAIADLEVAPPQDETELPTPTASVPDLSIPTPTFVDPAILSFNKPNARSAQSQLASNEAPISPIMIADGAISNAKVQGLRGVSSISSIATTQPNKKLDRRGSAATATLTEPFDVLGLDGKNGGDSKPAKLPSQTGPGIIDMKDINHGPLKPKKPVKGKGWRQTPFLEEPTNSKLKKQRGRRKEDDINGWATEDATDIQDMGDFDFESNLSKFDKRRVFDDIRKDDKIAESDRLVSFNRKAKPGTNGGRNLHFSENVLDPVDTNDGRWKSEAGETEEEGHQDDHYSSGRGTRRAGSKKPVPSRKGSVMPAHIERTASPRPSNRMSTSSPLNGSVSGTRASFRLANNKPCSCVSPLQMLEIEQLCTAELGLTEDMLSENAGRSIAEAILKSGDVRNILFLVGNHKSGARAIAAARHLRNRRLRVTVCVLGGDREELLFEIVRKQLSIYKKGLGYVERWDDYQSKLSNGGPSPDVVVDALLGIHTAFEELRTDDQATVFEMIKWASRSMSILSIDVPSGLSAGSGLISEVDGQGLMMKSAQVISLGAPKAGLLNAMAEDLAETTWTVLVADIGISTAAWQKHGSRRKHGIEFGGEWVIQLKVVAG